MCFCCVEFAFYFYFCKGLLVEIFKLFWLQNMAFMIANSVDNEEMPHWRLSYQLKLFAHVPFLVMNLLLSI